MCVTNSILSYQDPRIWKSIQNSMSLFQILPSTQFKIYTSLLTSFVIRENSLFLHNHTTEPSDAPRVISLTGHRYHQTAGSHELRNRCPSSWGIWRHLMVTLMLVDVHRCRTPYAISPYVILTIRDHFGQFLHVFCGTTIQWLQTFERDLCLFWSCEHITCTFSTW